MRSTLSSSKWRRQPTHFRGLDTDNALVSGLVLSCYNIAADYQTNGPRNYAQPNFVTPDRAIGTSSANVSFATDAMGVSPLFNGSSSVARRGLDMQPITKCTIAFWLYWDAFANDDKIVAEYTGNYNSNNAFLINPNSSTTGAFDFNLHGTSGYCSTKITRPSGAAWHHYAWTFDMSLSTSQTQAVYLDGVATTGTNTLNTMTASTFSQSDNIYLMNRGLVALFGAGRLSNFCIWNRILSAGEIYSHYLNPWQIMQPLQRAIYAPTVTAVSSGGDFRWFLAA